MINNKILNFSLLEGYQEKLGDIILKKMMTLYSEQSKSYLNTIELALPEFIKDTSLTGFNEPALIPVALEDKINEKFYAWQGACHKMKGASASVGLLEVYELAKIMEKYQGNRDEKIALLIQLKQKNKEGIVAFNDWCT